MLKDIGQKTNRAVAIDSDKIQLFQAKDDNRIE